MDIQSGKTVAGFGGAAAIILLFTWFVGWDKILSTVSKASPPLVLLGLATGFGSIICLGTAWWLVIREATGYTYTGGLRVFFATMFANSVTPLGQFGGEPFIAYIVSRDADIPIEEGFGAVLAADMINSVQFFTLTFLGILVFLVYFPMGPVVSFVLKLVIVLVGLLALGFVFIWNYRDKTLGLLRWVGQKVEAFMVLLGLEKKVDEEELVSKGSNFYAVLERLLGRRKEVAKALAFSHLSGLMAVGGLYLLILSLGFDAPKSALLFVLPASMLAGYLPLPGGLGGIEVALMALLTGIAGVPAAVASAAALLHRSATYWMTLLVGGFYSSRLSVDILSRRSPPSVDLQEAVDNGLD
ncbi:MAG: flippase-like domain-containing protein [Candidatus Nanohaloarchaeota archaeon QJJ-7]|nr:flippase-like domain-containing protein [Candidatus Nanohaloarchaeota archaeon QJJ-7]